MDSLLWHLLHPLLFWVPGSWPAGEDAQKGLVLNLWAQTHLYNQTEVLDRGHPSSDTRSIPPTSLPCPHPSLSPAVLHSVFRFCVLGLTSVGCLTEPFPSGFPVQPVKVSPVEMGGKEEEETPERDPPFVQPGVQPHRS